MCSPCTYPCRAICWRLIDSLGPHASYWLCLPQKPSQSIPPQLGLVTHEPTPLSTLECWLTWYFISLAQDGCYLCVFAGTRNGDRVISRRCFSLVFNFLISAAVIIQMHHILHEGCLVSHYLHCNTQPPGGQRPWPVFFRFVSQHPQELPGISQILKMWTVNKQMIL